MALIKCKDCGHEVSKEAKTCPNCGAPTTQKRKTESATSVARIILMVLAIFSIVPVMMYIGGFGLIIPVILFILALVLK